LTNASEEVEARAADLGPTLGVDRLEQGADLGVLARVLDDRHGSDVLEHDEVVLAAGRCARLDDIRHSQMGEPKRGIGLVLAGLGLFDIGGQGFRPFEDGRALLR
jgi:hypothetical protein